MKIGCLNDMKMTYSFIIPHHNNPELLNRCLSSIPVRNDIEIIVIDDNSLPDKKPNIERIDVKTYYIDAEHHTGPGGARNLGIENANGRWILFADCDDYYSDGFISILDKYKDSDSDILFYGMSLKEGRFDNGYETCVQKYLQNPSDYNLRMVKHIFQGPVNFMIRLDLVKQTNIRFDDGYLGEDAIFHHKIAMSAKKCEVTADKIYVVTYNETSLTAKAFDKKILFNNILPQYVKINNLKMEANAWSCISPFYQGIRGFVKKYGLFVTIIFHVKYLFALPWLKIWWNKHINQH